jgi:hypothetical protein
MPRIAIPRHLEQPFSVAQGRAAGLGPERMRGPDLVRPHHGVRAAADDDRVDTVGDRARRLMPVMVDGWYFSHITALTLWGLPVPGGVHRGHEPLHVSSATGRSVRRPGVVGHRVAPVPLRLVDGLPVAEPISAWVRSGQLMGLDDLVRVGDALAGSWSPLLEARRRRLDDLDRAIFEVGRVRGITNVREARALVRPGVESPKETELRLLLIRAGLPEPEINVRTHDRRGRYLGRPDLRYAWCKLAIEYEGDEHRRDPWRFRQDILRRERFADAGWRTVRCTDDDLRGRRADELVERVRRLLS